MPAAYICYSREDSDSEFSCARLRADLGKRLAGWTVVDSSGGQRSSREQIHDAIAGADVALVLLSHVWNPSEALTLEIATALASGIPTCAVALDAAEVPSRVRLPVAIRGLLDTSLLQLSVDSWGRDVDALAEAMRHHSRSRRPRHSAVPDAASAPAGLSTGGRDVFISYVEEDAGSARLLAQALREQGPSTWLYQDDGIPGISYLTQVNEAIESSRAVVIIASERAVKSHQVIREVEAAHDFARMIIPVRIRLTHQQFMESNRILRMATGTAVSFAMGDDVADVARRIAQALRAGSART